MVYSLQSRSYDEELLSAFGISGEMLPSIVSSTKVVGQVHRGAAERFGLAEGTPIVAGTGDDFATPIGAGIVNTGSLVSL